MAQQNKKAVPKRRNQAEILATILQNPTILELITTYQLTEQEMIDNLPLLIDIFEEATAPNVTKSTYLTSLIKHPDGSIQRVQKLSPTGLLNAFTKNILTQKIVPIDTEITINDIDKTAARKLIGAAILQFFQNESEKKDAAPKGLYIYGAVGIGKTFIAQAIANKLAHHNHEVAFLSLSDLILHLKANFEHGINDFLQMLKKVDYLFLDDIGSEPIASWFRDEILLSLLSSRMNNHKVTFLTSNYTYQELETIEAKTQKSKYLERNKAIRLLERIKALTTPIHLTGQNRRY